MNCSPPGSSVHGILQTRILEEVAISSLGDLPDLGIEPTSPMSPALKAVSLLTEPSGKPHYGGDRQFFKLMNILYSMLEVTNSYKGHQSRVSRTVLLSREGREDLIG